MFPRDVSLRILASLAAVLTSSSTFFPASQRLALHPVKKGQSGQPSRHERLRCCGSPIRELVTEGQVGFSTAFYHGDQSGRKKQALLRTSPVTPHPGWHTQPHLARAMGHPAGPR